jgi:hypothetical protein
MRHHTQNSFCGLEPTGTLCKEIQRWEKGEYASFSIEEIPGQPRIVLRFGEEIEAPGPNCVMQFRRKASQQDEVYRVIRSLWALTVEVCLSAKDRVTLMKAAQP